MAKYSEELKLKVVQYCIEGHHSKYEASKKFNIPAPSTIDKWVRKYKEHGAKGLIRNIRCSYSGEFKQNVIEYMQSNHLSHVETAIKFNLAGDYVVNEWEQIYYLEGPQGLYIERRGRSKNMNSKKKINKSDNESKDELIAENRRLKMEIEYLKKLNALVQERIKRENKKK